MDQQPTCQEILLDSREDFPCGIRIYQCAPANVAAVISGVEGDAGMLALVCVGCKGPPTSVSRVAGMLVGWGGDSWVGHTSPFQSRFLWLPKI